MFFLFQKIRYLYFYFILHELFVGLCSFDVIYFLFFLSSLSKLVYNFHGIQFLLNKYDEDIRLTQTICFVLKIRNVWTRGGERLWTNELTFVNIFNVFLLTTNTFFPEHIFLYIVNRGRLMQSINVI